MLIECAECWLCERSHWENVAMVLGYIDGNGMHKRMYAHLVVWVRTWQTMKFGKQNNPPAMTAGRLTNLKNVP